MNSFISSLYVLLDVIKAFGPVLASGFLGWVAYNQFKLAKSQSKISQEQLALAKQQADIAQRKVELDIRDRRYEVFKQWNEAYLNFKDHVYNDISKGQFIEAKNTFVMVSDEIFYIFSNTLVVDMVPVIKQEIQNIELHREEWLIKANEHLPEEVGWRWGDPFPQQVEPGFDGFSWCHYIELYDDKIRDTLYELGNKRKKLIDQALQQMKM